MRLLLLLVIGALGTGAAAWGLPRGGRAARLGALAGVAALVVVTADAFLLRPARLTDTGQPITGLFDAHLVTTVYLRLVVGLWGLEGLVLLFLAWLLGGMARIRTLLPATLAAVTAGTVAMASADLGVGAAAAAVTGLAALLIILAVDGPAAVAAGARELRVALLVGAVLLAVTAFVPVVARLALIASGVGSDEAPEAAGGAAGPVMGLITLAVAAVVAGRWGMLPFHLRVSRLTDLVSPETLPLLLAWIPVPLFVVAFAAVDRLISPLALPLDGERVLLVLLAVVTLAGAALAAFFHDDLRRVTGYLVIADSGLLLLAIAALDPAAWGPGRAWVVALAASKTALGAWAAVAEDRFETRGLPDLRGWIRRSPLLAVALAMAALATFGLPGWVAFETRRSLASLAVAEPWSGLVLLAGFLTLPVYLRLFWVGAGRVTSRVDRVAPERVVRRRKPIETLPVEMEGAEPATEPAEESSARVATATAATRAMAAGARTAASRARATAAGARATAAGATSSVRESLRRDRTPDPSAGAAIVGGDQPATPDAPAGSAIDGGGEAASPVAGATPATAERRTARRARDNAPVGERFVGGLRRNRTELLSAAAIALALLAVLTSWGALDIAGAAAEPAPIIVELGTD
jgi:NADH-quinone oxidoreductase subunit N